MDQTTINTHQELIDACKKCDRSAQFKIYKLYYKAMYNTSLRIVNDTAEAEDIMQDSFLDAFRRLGSYTGEGTFGSWLKRIVINNSLDTLRKEKDVVSLDEEEIDLSEEIPDQDEELVQAQVMEIKSAISELPEDYRVVLSLFLLEGYDHEEISEILNISNNLSRTRFVRAKQKVQSIIMAKRFQRTVQSN